MLQRNPKLDTRYAAFIRDIIQEPGRNLFPYIIVEDGQTLSQKSLVEMALSRLDEIPMLSIFYFYRLDEENTFKYKRDVFTPRAEREIRMAAMGRIPKSADIHEGIKAIRNSDLYHLFLKFRIPTPEELTQLEQQITNQQRQGLQKEIQEERAQSERFAQELQTTTAQLTAAYEEIRALQGQIEQLQNSQDPQLSSSKKWGFGTLFKKHN